MKKKQEAKYKLIIFDFDGTIADVLPHVVELFNYLSKIYHFTPITDIEHARGLTMRQLLKEYKVPTLRIPALMIEAQKKQLEYMDRIDLVKNLDKVITKLHNETRLGILSSNSKVVIDTFLQKRSMSHRFEFVVGCSKLFSKSVPLSKITRSYRLNPSEVLYVGDEVGDITAAKKVGMHCAAVTWGLNSEKILKTYSPDYIIKKPEDLLKIV